MPSFWIGLMFITVFSVQLHWFPTSGYEGLKHLILHAATVSFFSLASNAIANARERH
jgi:ABC-type dipeptide/oligopeptide/nickel transport system permease component